MKPHQRRHTTAYPYYKLAVWDDRSMTFRDGKVAFATEDCATSAATAPGRYRLSVVTESGRRDLAPFEV